jgi:hypothetical protein
VGNLEGSRDRTRRSSAMRAFQLRPNHAGVHRRGTLTTHCLSHMVCRSPGLPSDERSSRRSSYRTVAPPVRGGRPQHASIVPEIRRCTGCARVSFSAPLPCSWCR